MKKLFLFQIALLIGTVSMAQTPNYEWARTLGGSSDDRATSVVVDKSGNVYTTGSFMDQVDFDPDASSTYNLTSNGGKDIYISKMDVNGKFVWAVNIGDGSDDAGNSIKLDANGDVYVTGYFMDKPDFDPGKGSAVLASAGSQDIFVCKFDASGNYVWASRMGGSGDDAGNGITLDPGGDVITTGYFSETCDFDPGVKAVYDLTSNGSLDVFVSRLNSTGGFGWAVQMGGGSDDAGNSVALDSFGNVYSTGYFRDKADFIGVTLVPVDDKEIFVVKLNAKGAYAWAVSAADKGPDEGLGITVDAVGNSYTTGYFYNMPDFDPLPKDKKNAHELFLTSAGNVDIFVWKLDASGLVVWAKGMGGSGEDAGTAITLDASKNVLTTGVFNDAVDFDPGSGTETLTSNGAYDVFISRLSNAGNYDWAMSIGESDQDGGLGIAIDKFKSVYIAGAFSSGKMDFDPGSGSDYYASNGSEDAFTLKLSLCKASMTDVPAKACNSYDYNGNTYYKSGDYPVTLKNVSGCDSIVTLKLTINLANYWTEKAEACDKYTANGETFYKEGVYDQTLTNMYGCDSFLTIDLKFLTTARTIKQKACNSFTANGSTYTSTGVYTQHLTNKAGCDSALTFDLTVYKSTSSNPVVTACDEYSLNGKTFTKTGIYSETLMNNASCDSNVTLNLTVNYSSVFSFEKDACSSYTLNAFTYNKSGDYTQMLKTTKGCDSTIKVKVSINNTAYGYKTTACQSYKLNNQTYNESGVYVQTIPNKKGCDSTITLDLTVKKVITTVTQIGGTLTSNANGAVYQWLDCNKGNAHVLGEIYQNFTPTKTGDYAVQVTQNNCTDNSICYNVNLGNVSNTLANSIQVFPNPTNGETTVLLGNILKNGTIKLISITGQTLMVKSNLTGNSFPINITDQAKGIYFIEISQDGNVSRVKLVKD